MGYARLKNLTEEEKLERKKQQKREAQKRYYAKNKEKYREYANTYYQDVKDENVLLKCTLKDIKNYIMNVPNYKHLSYFMTIIEKIDGVIDDNR
jgi:hypothetical protein